MDYFRKYVDIHLIYLLYQYLYVVYNLIYDIKIVLLFICNPFILITVTIRLSLLVFGLLVFDRVLSGLAVIGVLIAYFLTSGEMEIEWGSEDPHVTLCNHRSPSICPLCMFRNQDPLYCQIGLREANPFAQYSNSQ